MLIGLEVQGQISLQSLQDGGRVRQGQTLSQDPCMGLTHLGEVKEIRIKEGRVQKVSNMYFKTTISPKDDF